MSNVVAGDKVVSNFDRQGRVRLKAVIKHQTPVTDLANRLVFLLLYEVWILPEEAEAFSNEILNQASFNSTEEMLVYYDMNRANPSHHAVGRLSNLLGEIGANMGFSEAASHVSVINTEHGPVISFVVGNRRALEKVYDQSLRIRPESESASLF